MHIRTRRRTPLGPLVALSPLALVVGALAGCSGVEHAETPASASATTTAPTITTPTEADPVRITIELDGETLTGRLTESATARALAAQLPATLTFSDHGGQEQIARLPAPLDTTGAPSTSDAPVGTIAYYVPDQSIVLYYTDVGSFPGIVPIGAVDDVQAVRDLPSGAATIRVRD
ncbi:cyclophilin-like fold protein [Curtobacterium sp. MCBD17_026]|uniref:cyclophilin-like fold protein n=1 Tax=Curtobacterium sp. MCBD17_026 TaxID=2175621 RepID=UPI000DA89CFD|nr:cyclophilin-like fold protein [Curtobacterium sp. MCBD17_026]WIB69376.1 cyclophilin-like fold protein [Curtobacterium sp. MCBD17_026]